MRALLKEIEAIPTLTRFGRVARIEGLAVEVTGAQGAVSLGGQCRISIGNNKKIPCEVIGFRDGRALVMPLGSLDGITLGARADFEDRPPCIYPSRAWLGRVVNGFGEAMDGKGKLAQGARPIRSKPRRRLPPRAARIGAKLDLGVRALNAFVTCCKGQRMGIFAGSGVGKSTLLAMLARNTDADAIVIGLIGERGREVKEFIEDDLGRGRVKAQRGGRRHVGRSAAGAPPGRLCRHGGGRRPARSRACNVLLLMDSVTRFAMAQREIGLSAGEPPASKGYTPTVFAELPRLLERAGPGAGGPGLHHRPVYRAGRGR